MNIQKYIFLSLVWCVSLIFTDDAKNQTSKDLQVSVQAQKTKKVSVGLVILGHHDTHLKACVDCIKKDLEWSGQCLVVVEHRQSLKHEKDLKELFDRSVAVAVIISKIGNEYSWR